jgi:hypothetical protein
MVVEVTDADCEKRVEFDFFNLLPHPGHPETRNAP